MEKLKSLNSLLISQKKEWGEILTGFDTKNKYVISDKSGETVYYAAEEGGSLLSRFFLKSLRPFTIVVLTDSDQVLLRVKRVFRFWFHEAKIVDSQDESLGVLKKRFSIFRRKYSVFDCNGEEIYQLFGPILKPWTFFIKHNGIAYGKITKKWSGLLKESFTEADNFGVVFPESGMLK